MGVVWWLQPAANKTDEGTERITAWAAANGLDAAAIPEDAQILIEDKTITVPVVEEEGPDDVKGRRWKYDEMNRPVTKSVTVPLREMPPDDLFRACPGCVKGSPHDHF